MKIDIKSRKKHFVILATNPNKFFLNCIVDTMYINLVNYFIVATYIRYIVSMIVWPSAYVRKFYE